MGAKNASITIAETPIKRREYSALPRESCGIYSMA